MKKEERRITFKQVTTYFSEWWLISEGSEKWTEDPRVMRIWNLALASMLAITAALLIVEFVFEPLLKSIPFAAGCFRGFAIAAFLWLLAMEAKMAITFYRHLLLTGLDLRFKSIFTFWCGWVMLFGFLYKYTYSICSRVFFYPSPILKYSNVMVRTGAAKRLEEMVYFFTYSAATAVTTSVPFLSSASVVVSIMNVVEVIGSLLLTAVFVATLVNKAGENSARR